MTGGYCKHFCGAVTPVCDAGVNIRQHVGGPDYGWATRLPCSKRLSARDPSVVVPCDKYQEPTAEEIAAEEAVMNAAMERMVKSLPWVESIKKANKGVAASGSDTCPVCGGVVHWSHAACNGHVHACCETENCLNFME